MSHDDNPAGRLFALLERLSAQEQGHPLVTGWAGVLGVSQEDVPLRLGVMGQLVPAVQAAAEEHAPAFRPMVARHRDAWLRVIFPLTDALNSPLGTVLPDAAAFESLAALDAHLHAVAPEGRIPDDEQLEQINEQLGRVLEDVQASKDLPEEIKHEIASRLRDVQQAIDHVNIGGPHAVQRAMEALVGSIAFTTLADEEPEAGKKTDLRSRIGAIALIVWVAFSSSADFQKNLEATTHMAGELTAAAESVVDAKGDHPASTPPAHSPQAKKK